MNTISVHLSKAYNTGPDWSGPLVQVAPRLQKIIQPAKTGTDELEKGDGQIFYSLYLDLFQFFLDIVKKTLFVSYPNVQNTSWWSQMIRNVVTT